MSKQIINYLDGTSQTVQVAHSHRVRAEMDMARMGISLQDANLTWLTHAMYHAVKSQHGENKKFMEWLDTIDDFTGAEDDDAAPLEDQPDQL